MKKGEQMERPNQPEDHWNTLLQFYAILKEGTPGEHASPPHLELDGSGTLEDGRIVYAYLVPKYTDDFSTKDGYLRCYDHAERVRDLLNEEIESVGITAYRPGTRWPGRRIHR